MAIIQNATAYDSARFTYCAGRTRSSRRRERFRSLPARSAGFDPGCTLEIQIEERSGRVIRITTTDTHENDRQIVRDAVIEALDRMWAEFDL